MKKLLILSLALAAAVSCSKEQTIGQPDPVAIEINDVFVNNSTKANDISKDNLNDFGVYGFVKALNTNTEGMLFNNVRVAKEGNKYIYSPEQYWIGNAQYYFAAFAPYDNAEWTYTSKDAQNGTITFDNQEAEANQDFLFAYTKPAVTPNKITSAEKPGAVGFTFKHMLSRIKFSFTNGFEEGSNISLKITDVTITNAHKNGFMVIEAGEDKNWTVDEQTFTKVFGAVGTDDKTTAEIDETKLTPQHGASTEHFYLIPAKASYIVTFNIALYQAGVLLDNYSRKATFGIEMQKGFSYDIKATLNANNTSDDGELFPIEFTVNNVEGWGSFNDVNASVNN